MCPWSSTKVKYCIFFLNASVPPPYDVATGTPLGTSQSVLVSASYHKQHEYIYIYG